jgi:hypothetical protein
MGETLLAIAALFALFGFVSYIVADMINYAPGERRKVMVEHRTQRHSRSHYNTRRK